MLYVSYNCTYVGGGVSVAIDEEGLIEYAKTINEARTTMGVRQMVVNSNLVRSRNRMKCSLEVQFASSGM